MKPKLNYNERSWAIDVIGYIKTYTNKKNNRTYALSFIDSLW